MTGPGPGGPPPFKPMSDGLSRPKRLRDYPRYAAKRIRGFFERLFYIISLVWESAPLMLVFMVLLCLLDGVLPVVGAYISKDLLNEIAALITERSMGAEFEDVFNTLKPLFFLFGMNMVYLFFSRVLKRLNNMVTGIAGELVVNHIKLKIIGKAREVDLRSFDRPEFYEKLENANREAGMRPIMILNATFSVVSALISAVSFVAVLFALSPYAPFIIIIAAIPGALVNYAYRNRNFRYVRRHSKERRQMNYYSGLMVNKDMVKEIKILGLSDTFISKYKSVFARYYKGLKSLIIKEGVMQILVALLSTAVNSALFVYIAYTVVFGTGEVGDYSLFSGALGSIAGYITTLLTATATIYEGTLFIDNMIEFMKEEVTVVPTLDEPRRVELGKPHTIELRGVSFRYPGTDRYVLRDINLTLRPAESVVLVGLNGAGKTTLIKLITRLYDPTEGAIYLDGHDVREYDVESLYNMFGIVFQDFGHYAESVAENIEFGDVHRTHERETVEYAARQGSADGFIGELPKGYDTPLTRMFEEDGIELSGGQWQKLSVARAFYKRADVLILDEPTASLDPLAEAEVFNQFAALSENRITIFVSHRLSSAVNASKIVVIDGGRVAEEGTHEELMRLGGSYYRLFTTQANRYISNS
ncbi:MAG: ABC transporter ATP-binding protein [Clostridia bacterium]|nr:ABC transporter ATP-binding protein [Clostridia bacterium]